jgi:serralysin
MNALTFNAAPDFENPGDADGKNTYEVTFTATEGSETTVLGMTVTVKDAYEGRVIDGPVSGSSVFTDCNGDTVQDAGEFSTTSDSNGFYFVEKASDCASPKLVAIGGTDTSTGTEIPDLALIADVPQTESASAYITPISTVIALATTADEKEAVLAAFGITGVTPEELLTKDIWADSQSADEATASLSLAIANVNVQIATILQTAVTFVDTSDSTTAALRAITMVSEMSKALVTKATEVTSSSGFVSGSLLSATSDLEAALTAAFTAYETAAVTLSALSDDAVVVAAGQTVAEAVALKISAFTSVLEESTARLVETVSQIAAISDITSAVATQALKLREDKVAQLDSFVATAESAFSTEYATYTASIAAAGADSTAVSAAISALSAGVSTTVDSAVATAITALETTLDALETAAATAAAALETELVTTGHKLPTTITVLETVE